MNEDRLSATKTFLKCHVCPMQAVYFKVKADAYKQTIRCEKHIPTGVGVSPTPSYKCGVDSMGKNWWSVCYKDGINSPLQIKVCRYQENNQKFPKSDV